MRSFQFTLKLSNLTRRAFIALTTEACIRFKYDQSFTSGIDCFYYLPTYKALISLLSNREVDIFSQTGFRSEIDGFEGLLVQSKNLIGFANSSWVGYFYVRLTTMSLFQLLTIAVYSYVGLLRLRGVSVKYPIILHNYPTLFLYVQNKVLSTYWLKWNHTEVIRTSRGAVILLM